MLAETLISSLFIFFFFFLHLPVATHSSCLALASYYIPQGSTLSYIASLFSIPFVSIDSDILPYNPVVTNKDLIRADSRILIPFSCPSPSPALLPYNVSSGDTYDSISIAYANLTTPEALGKVNSFPSNRIPVGAVVNIPVECFCGDRKVDRRFGLFATYPLRNRETLASVAGEMGFTDTELLRRFNPGVDFAGGKGIVFVPARDRNGSYLPLKTSGISEGAIAGISVAAVVLLLLVVCFVVVVCRRRRAKKARVLATNAEMHPLSDQHDAFRSTRTGGVSSFTGISVDKSVQFSYEELARATDDFSMASKIGSGGFGDVFYAELRGEKTAIKKMVMESSREFLSELKVLTHVHHLNLVRLIGYCTEGALFLIYEYIENGDLSQHLHGSGRQPLSWASRVQIALDSARGLEYIHEHTVPVYIHRDVKSPNILIDKTFHAKVADFGLAKLTEVGTSTQTRLVGTFGYMPPEYANLGDVSPKVDVYAFGVVLYELISAKQAIVRTSASITETKGLVALFDDVLNLPDAKAHLPKLVDSRLNDNYPIDVVYKMAQIGKACTEENPQLRPSMRSVVVSLMTLSSSTEEYDLRPLYENQALSNLMSGR